MTGEGAWLGWARLARIDPEVTLTLTLTVPKPSWRDLDPPGIP